MSGQVDQSHSRVRVHDATASGSAPLKNPRFEKLSREFAAGATQADAWRAAYGTDPSTGNPSRTFARPEVEARIEFLRDAFNRQAGISLAALQARLLRIADANVVRFFEADEKTGQLRLRDLTKLPAAITAPITELRIDADGAIKLKTADQLRAIEGLLKTIGAFAPESDAGGKGATLEEMVMASLKTDRPTALRMEVVTNAPRPPDSPQAHRDSPNAAPRENQIETQTERRRVRLDGVRIQRAV
jgi:hypothetical protein